MLITSGTGKLNRKRKCFPFTLAQVVLSYKIHEQSINSKPPDGKRLADAVQKPGERLSFGESLGVLVCF